MTGSRELGWALARRALFRLDAETAHHLTTRSLAALDALGPCGRIALRALSGAWSARVERPASAFGLAFRNRVGLAAGMDKNAELLPLLPWLGFGFAEIGTVTPRPQPGNPRPRLFREPASRSVFNRMGFNGLGASLVSARLGGVRARGTLPPGFRVGVNVGKNKDTALDEAARDYSQALAPFRGLVDYVVVNVSSPNTPGLRSLQSVEALAPILDAVGSELSRWSGPRPPVLIKLAPELGDEELAALGEASRGWAVAGWILTNTLAGVHAGLPGGWSGGRLRDAARARLAAARAPLAGFGGGAVSVGGILDPEDVRDRLAAGAALVQVYSGWIFGGPSWVPKLVEASV